MTQDGRVVALVAVGITIAHIEREIWGAVATITAAGAAVLAIGAAGVLLIARRLRRQTHGLSPVELTRMYEYHQAVLHAVREGLLLLDADHRVQLANAEAHTLLGLPPDAQGRRITELGLPQGLVAAAVGERAQSDDLYLIGGNALLVSSAPARRGERTVGAVVTVRDRTELQAVSGELDVVRQLTDALRAQNHESANRLHTVVSLVEMGRPDEAIDFATEELQVAQMLTDTVVAEVGDPVLAALLLGKSAQAAERGVTLGVRGVVQEDRMEVESRALVTLTGNLIDNALDAVATGTTRNADGTGSTGSMGSRGGTTDPSDAGLTAGSEAVAPADHGIIDVDVTWDPDRFELRVGDNGPGIPPQDAGLVLQHGWSSKAAPAGGRGIGLALVAQIATRHGGGVEIARSALGGAQITVTLRRSP